MLVVCSARGAVLHVRAEAAGPETNGLSWVTAFTTITQALQHATAGDELWVAEGTYPGVIDIPADVFLFGGFAGDETARTQRDWGRNRSVIDWNESGDSYPFLYQKVGPATLLGRGGRLDGFTVINGWHEYGAAIYTAESSATIANNIIVTNHATGMLGSAVLVDNTGAFSIGEDFFLKTANDLLRLQFPFGATNIPVAQYSPAVHRLLQVAANTYDAARSNVFPSVFRPQFAPTPEGMIITGYYEDNSCANVPAWLATNAYGIPMIIGARKGFPNFNELALQTSVLVARKLELRRHSTNSPPYQTNEMYIVGISNFVGVETWNSYTQPFGHDLEIAVGNVCVTTLKSGDATVARDERVTSVLSNVPAGSWHGFALGAAGVPSFKVPLFTNHVPVTNSAFRFDPGFLEPLPATFEADSGFRIPEWQLSISNGLAFLLSSGGRIVDFVLLQNLTNTVNLTELIFQPFISTLNEGAIAQCWRTNRAGPGVYAATEGVQAQLDVSLGGIPVSQSQWREFDFGQTQNIDTAKQSFMQFVFPGSQGNANTNLVQVAPFSPARKLVISANWQANDPAVHALAEHLKDGTNNIIVNSVRPFFNGSNMNHALGKLNTRYRPWGGNPGRQPGPEDFDSRIKDIGVWSSDAFRFPNGNDVNVRWLDRIHRGTPWQTLYFGKEAASMDVWLQHFPDSVAHPTSDWLIIDYLRGQLNYAGPPNPTRVVNNTIAGNSGSGLWIAADANVSVMNNAIAYNSSGIFEEGGNSIEFSRNCVFGNEADNVGDIVASPQFVNPAAGDFSVVATSPLIDAGNDLALGWMERNVLGAEVDIGALEFGADGVPAFTFGRTSPTEYHLELRGFPGQTYVIEGSTNLVDWTAITTNVAAIGTVILQDAAGTNHTQRFYRCKVANHPN